MTGILDDLFGSDKDSNKSDKDSSKGDKDKSSLVEMGGRDVAPSKESRATEVSIRGFWNGYRDLMGV